MWTISKIIEVCIILASSSSSLILTVEKSIGFSNDLSLHLLQPLDWRGRDRMSSLKVWEQIARGGKKFPQKPVPNFGKAEHLRMWETGFVHTQKKQKWDSVTYVFKK